MTGLPNRILFHDRLHGAIQRANRHHSQSAPVCIDIGGFTHVNNSHGHPAGDALLQEIAARPSAHLRSNDTVARLGGDEFALVLEDIEDPSLALQLCGKSCAALGEPYALSVNGRPTEVRIGASIGVARYRPNEHPDTDERLMQAADHAMYEARRGGKNRCVLAD